MLNQSVMQIFFSGQGSSVICAGIASSAYLYFCPGHCSCDMLCCHCCFWRLKSECI